MVFRRTRFGGSWLAAKSSRNGSNLSASVHAVTAIQTRISMVAGSAHTAGAALRLGVPSLRRDQVELLLRLIEAETDPLLVEQP